ncbi:MAG: hypothetical protein KUG77_27220 [Nannocystaceae bacterium]|nr:hypothetical protein [Nannocystaceae bacterium]
MSTAVTYIAPIKLAAGVTEDQFFAASARFQTEFVAHEPGVLRRELIKKADGVFADIVLFRSVEDAQQVIEKEQSSEVCGAFFSLMDMSSDAESDPAELGPFPSIAVYE